MTSRGGTLFQSVLPAALTSAAYDAANRLTNWTTPGGTTLPVYDANGNLTGDGTRTFAWDSRNRLTAITGTAASFAYDAAGRRTTATLGGSATSFLYDGPDIVQEQTGGAVSASLLTGLGIDERFSRTAGSTNSTYLTDNLGSTVALADASGVVQTSYGYDAYGVTSLVAGTANSSRYQYTGRENDGATGLYFYRARYYNPAWGRFISEDPIGLGSGKSDYRYVGNRPLDRRDPLGLFEVSVTGGGIVGGHLAIGYNNGQISVTSHVGFGEGLSFSYTPSADSPSSSGTHHPGFEFSAKGSASAGIGVASASAAVELDSHGRSVELSGNIVDTPVELSAKYAGGDEIENSASLVTGESAYVGVGGTFYAPTYVTTFLKYLLIP